MNRDEMNRFLLRQESKRKVAAPKPAVYPPGTIAVPTLPWSAFTYESEYAGVWWPSPTGEDD